MAWLVLGQVLGTLAGLYAHKDSTKGNIFYNKVIEYADRGDCLYFTIVWIVLLVAVTPALGGFVVVGLMIKEFGSCVLV